MTRRERGAKRPDKEQGPLAGLMVLDAGNMIAGPMAATILADYGADVVKLEHPEHGDPLRDWEPKREGVSLWWKVLNRNKRLITLSLSHADGRALFLDLVRRADVVIENFRPGTFEKWGLGYEALAEANPGIVLARISGYGQTGPYATRPGYGTIAEAMSGIPFFTGHSGGPPTLPAFPMADTVSAVFTAVALLAALRERDSTREKKGQQIDLGLYEALFRLVDSQVIGYDQLGIVKERIGNRMAEDAPRNAYQTADGRWIAISASSNRTWERLANAIGAPELAFDPRFDSSSSRVEHVSDLDEILGAWFARHQCDDALQIFGQADVVAGPVMSIEDIFNDPQYMARHNIVEVPDLDFGSVKMQGVVPKFSRTPGHVHFAGMGPGAHNRDIYCGLLGLASQDLARLSAAGAI